MHARTVCSIHHLDIPNTFVAVFILSFCLFLLLSSSLFAVLVYETMSDLLVHLTIWCFRNFPGFSWKFADETFLGQLQTGKDLQYGRVAPAELVQAVHEMLSAAGVSIDMETQTLLRTNLTLQEQLKDSQAAFLLEQVFNFLSLYIFRRKKWKKKLLQFAWKIDDFVTLMPQLLKNFQKLVHPSHTKLKPHILKDFPAAWVNITYWC